MGHAFDTDPAGWYDDPAGLAQQRYWSGAEWTPWVWDGSSVTAGPMPLGSLAAPRTERGHLAYVRDVFLPGALDARVAPPHVISALDDYARALDARATWRTPVAAGTVSAPPPVAAPTGPPRPVAWPTTARPPLATPPTATRQVPLQPMGPRPYRPGPVARWWDRTRDAVGSDLAAHGLAYLGVLLLFVGVFGLVAFAFGDVAPTARPVAELVIAVAPFAAAWMLLRRGAEIAGRALETAGGLLLPIMLITSFLDGVEAPPDATGPVLVLTLTVLTAAVSAAYALWSTRHHDSALRYLVAPVAWLAVALATTGVGRDIPSGRDVASVTTAQVAAVAVAVLVSLAGARLRPDALLSAPTFTATIPALVVLGPLAVLTWAAGGWPEIPIAVTGVTGLLVLEFLIGRLSRSVVTVIQPLWWAVVGLALVPSLGLPAAAVCAAAGFLALLELEASDGSSWLPMTLSGTGLAVSLLGLWSQPWWAFAAMVALSGWAHTRRMRPYPTASAPLALDLAAGILPIAAVVALGLATESAPVAVLVGTVLALIAAWPATRHGEQPLLRRDATDHFWVLWWDAAMVVSVIALGLIAVAAWPTEVPARWLLVASAAVLAASAAAGPMPAYARAWPVLVLATWSWLLVGTTLALAPSVLGAGIAAAALAVVAWTHAAPAALPRWHEAGSTGLAGLVLGLVGVAVTTGALGWWLVAAVGLATAGWVLTTAYAAVDRSPATTLLARTTVAEARFVPVILAAVGMPTTVLLALDAAGLVSVGSPWTPVVFAATAVVYAAATRLPVGGLVSTTLGWSACVAAVAAPLLTWEARPALVALVALVATALVLPAARRPIGLVWLAWAALAPIAGLVLAEFTSAYDGRSTTTALAVTLVDVGSAMLLAAAALDLRGRPWQPVWRPTHDVLLPVAALGAAEVLAGLAVSTAVVEPSTAGWLTVAVAGVAVVTAALTRAWSLVGLGAALGWMSVMELRGDDVLAAPWVSVAATVLFAAAAEAAHRLVRDARWWVRADWPLAALAHVTAFTALVSAGSGDSFSLTWAAVGLLCVVVALRVRTVVPVASAYAVLGTGLVLVGAASAGPGWLALALAVTSLGCSVVASRATGVARLVLLTAGALAALAAWLSMAAWLDWTSGQTVDRTVLLAAAVALVSAVLLRRTAVDRAVLVIDGGLAVLVATFAPFVPVAAGGDAGTATLATSAATCVALAAVAVGGALAARPLGLQWLRYAALGYLVMAAAEWSDVARATPDQQLGVLGAATALCAFALVNPWAGPSWTAWRRPVAALGVLTSTAGVAVSLAPLPDTGLMTTALLLAALMSTAIAVDTGALLAQVATPVLVCAAWIVYAASALDGNPQWFLVPLGVTILVIVGLLRSRLRSAGSDPARAEVVLLEWAGIACIVGPSFVQAFTVGLGYAALAAFLGLLVAAWGVLTRVRRRVTAGAAVVLAALLVLVAVPLAQLLPAWGSAALWITIAVIGLLALVGATLLEKGRAVVRSGLDGFRGMTEGWE